MSGFRLAGSAPLAALAGAVILTGCSGGPRGASPASPPPTPAGFAKPGRGAPTTDGCLKLTRRRCYQPFQLQRAYDLLPLYRRGLDGSGRTIVVAVPFGSPTIRSDLHHFNASFGLPDPVLTVLQPVGPVPPSPRPDRDRVVSALEASLDVEWAHAIAPGARIVLVETPTPETEGTTGFPQIVAAERFVIDHGIGDVISESFGATEQTFHSPASILGLRGAEQDALKHRVTMVAASGDQGAANFEPDLSAVYPRPTVIWPASDPLVTAVGGTSLKLDAAGRRLGPDTVWHSPLVASPYSAAGGGLSSVFPRPAYQDSVRGVVGNHRGVPDVSMSAAREGAVDVYVSAPGGPGGWTTSFGTSEAAPLFAGIVAIADQAAGRRLGLLGPALYRLAAAHAPGIVDVTEGDNSFTYRLSDGGLASVVGYRAGRGYDLASGLGTVDAARLVPELAAGSR